MTSFVEIFSILAPKPLYIKMQSLFFTFKLVTISPFLSSDVRVVLRPSRTCSYFHYAAQLEEKLNLLEKGNDIVRVRVSGGGW